MPPLVVHIVTLAVFFIGFAFGYAYRSWKERVDALEALKKAGIDKKLRAWVREEEPPP